MIVRFFSAFLMVLALFYLATQAYRYVVNHPADFPWTALRLNDPIGMWTRTKLLATQSDKEACQRVFEQAGVTVNVAPAKGSGQCRVDNAVSQPRAASIASRLSPSNVTANCSVMSAYYVWESQVLQPAAKRFFDAQVTQIQHYGTYSCRRMYGRSEGRWSEHATANALDVAGFTLSDGTRISLQRDWTKEGPKAQFLREIRDGACRLFSTVLSPDYNAAHADHFHLDQASRGQWGIGVCR